MSKRLFKRDNILILILLAGAFLGVFGIPQRYGITSEVIILALLGILALDTIMERVGYLDRIEQRLNDIERKFEPILSADELFQSRDLMVNFDVELQRGHQFWVYGSSLNGLLSNHHGQIEDAARKGKKFRFVITDYKKTDLVGAIASSSKTYPNTEETERLGEDAVRQIKRLISNTPEGSIEVKLAGHVSTYSLRIIDGEKENGCMVMEQYAYKISPWRRLHVNLSKTKDPNTYSFFLEQFKQIWTESGPLEE